MKRFSCVILMALSSTVFAQDDLPEVESLLPEPNYYVGERSQFSRGPAQEAKEENSQEQLLLRALQRINALQEQVQELTGKVEEQEFKLSQIQALYTRELDGLKQVMNRVNQVAQPDIAFNEEPQPKLQPKYEPKPEANPVSAFEFKPTSASPRLEGEVYQSAYQHLQAKRYTQAKADFQEVLANYPNGQFAPNASYWLGEIYLLQDNYDKAQEAFKSVTQKFSTHPKSADALLKLGFVAVQQRQYEQAKSYFIEVKQKFPNTVAARLAENRLNQLGNS